jgi:excisionase family DNA binding protein
VTVGELAEYWLVSRKQIYKQIDAGTLRAIKLGPRLLRISTREAVSFERRANMHPPARHKVIAAPPARSASVADRAVRGSRRR